VRRTAVVVVPRERFTSLPVSLRSLFSTIAVDVPVVVVEGATPPATRRELEALARDRPFELVSLPYMVKPNEARNIGVARTDTEYVVIADNDIEYEPGWLDALEQHAADHESDAVAPLIFIGPPATTVIHHAGGLLSATRDDGGVRLSEHHRLMDVRLDAVDGAFPEPYNHVCEFHCMMARRSLLDEMGGLDERLITREQIDFALRALALGAKTTFAEQSWVTYMAKDVFAPVDLRYHLFRWSDPFVVESLDALENGWGVTVDREMYRFSWAAAHRARAAETTYPWRRKVLGKERFRRRVVDPLERRVVAEQLALRNGLEPSLPRDLPPEAVTRVIEGLLVASSDVLTR
jgi:GT2 family glycosyltransferase